MKGRNMDEESLIKEFAYLNRTIYSPEAQADIEAEIREDLAAGAREHRHFLAASRQAATYRSVR